ncbi:growth arrest-specific protein 1-like [Silurus asotus]|uniref:Growth arrest-specific protein 1-like n=1 Tax=Silurus asotus TaxID=30991 RepID=A0AAD5FPV0_SILAS|nr:growth arrest-specific protein 1-like [Silurus asotus]
MGTWRGPAAFLLCLAVALSAEPACWQAVLRCHDERDCELAYTQYLVACDANIRGALRRCPSHCVGALVLLNQTARGPDLETCDCGADAECRRAKRAIEPCLPRAHARGAAGIGCTEARQRCEEETACRAALSAYLAHCGQLFNGRMCAARCRAAIEELRLLPDGAPLERCVCDGVERPFCEVVKDNMSRLCALPDRTLASDQDVPDDAYEDEDYELKVERDVDTAAVGLPSRAWCSSNHLALFLGSLTLTFLRV